MNHFLHVTKDSRSVITPHGMHYAVDTVCRHTDKRYPNRLVYVLGVREDGDFLDALVIHNEGFEHTVGKTTSLSFTTFRQKYQTWNHDNWRQYESPSQQQRMIWSFEYLAKQLGRKHNALTASLARDIVFESEKVWKDGQRNLLNSPNFTRAEAVMEVSLKLQAKFRQSEDRLKAVEGILRELKIDLAKDCVS